MAPNGWGVGTLTGRVLQRVMLGRMYRPEEGAVLLHGSRKVIKGGEKTENYERGLDLYWRRISQQQGN
jgi:hypothetical protein